MARRPAKSERANGLKALSNRLREGGSIPEDQIEVLDTLASQLARVTNEVMEGAEVAVVKSAIPLTEEERIALRKKLENRFGDRLTLRWEVDPTILGGVLIRVGDKIIDGSVAGKLASLKRSLIPRR